MDPPLRLLESDRAPGSSESISRNTYVLDYVARPKKRESHMGVHGNGWRADARDVRLATVLSAILFGLANGNQVFAQAPDPKAQDGSLEEVIVTGIRSSLRQAMEIKRNSDVIVDSIASESLGKFPDTNIAESLQRITGVSIDRSGGEGQAITVRGFGPQFNTVLLNGRRIVSDTGARSFNFDVLPAELISRVD